MFKIFLINILTYACIVFGRITSDDKIKQHSYQQPHIYKHLQTPQQNNHSKNGGQEALEDQNGLSSPFNVFLNNYNDDTYYADVQVINNKQSISAPYKISVDINIPFIFLTEKKHNSLQSVTKLTPTDEQLEQIVSYIKPKFAAIKNYQGDIFYGTNCALKVNPYIGTDIEFFYLIGFGAEEFQKATKLEGYLGLGKQQPISQKQNDSLSNESSVQPQKIELSYLIHLKEQNLISNTSYSLYFGNSPGYVDSIFFLGGYQQFFIQNQTQFQELKMIQGCNQSWCFKINYINLLKNDTQIYQSKQAKLYNTYISSTYQFIFIPQEIADALVYHIQQDDTIQCEFNYYQTYDRNHTVLQCSTKLQISIPQKFPIINFIIQQNKEQITITLTPQQYIEKCLDDVENYAFKCYTYFAIYNSNIDLFKPDFDIIFGLPFLRVYYTYYDLQNTSLFITKAYYYDDISLISKFWYYSFMALLVCWAFIMMSCGIFFKDQMDQMILFVCNILKYLSGDQQARMQVLMDYLADDE